MEWRFWRKKCFICRRAVRDRYLDGSWYIIGMGREMAYVHHKCLHSLAGGIRVKIIEIEKVVSEMQKCAEINEKPKLPDEPPIETVQRGLDKMKERHK